MKRISVTGIALVIVSIIWVSTVWCSEQQGPGQSPSGPSNTEKTASAGMMSSKKTEKMDKMHEMMGKMVDKAVQEKIASMKEELGEKKEINIDKGFKYHQKGRIGAHALMGPFHEWMRCLMCRQPSLALTSGQKENLDEALTKHLMSAIRARAEARALQLDLKHGLRKQPLDLQAIETLVRKLTEQRFKLLMEGVKLYNEVLGILTADQRAKAEELIGSPFPPSWEEMPPRPCPKSLLSGPSKSSSKKGDQRKQRHEGHHR